MAAVVPGTDAALAIRALSGDDTAFSLLVIRHTGWALRFIRRHVRHNEDAYDLLQDTFISAWLALGRYELDRPFDVWLRHVALNKCRDQARRAAVRCMSGGFSISEDTPEVADSAPGPAELIEGRQELHRLARDMRKLSRSLQQPLRLTAIDGLSHFEAGNVLGLSAKAVEMRVYRARARLEKLRGEHRHRVARRGKLALGR
jgi:RNA polymerase sigma factor (sigma-70 family)